MNQLLTAYIATTISIMGRFVFMWLLYTRKSTNLYSLIFSVMNIVFVMGYIQSIYNGHAIIGTRFGRSRAILNICILYCLQPCTT